MRILLVITLCSLLLCSCGGGLGGGSTIAIKSGGKDSSLTIKSSGIDRSVKTFTDVGGKVSTATSTTIVLANFDMDTTNLGTMRKPVSAADQIKIELNLISEEGTDQKGATKTGIYKADPTGKFMKVDGVDVASFADGKEQKTRFDMMFSGSKVTGQIEITSASEDSVSGNIDVTEGDKSVKGSFTAKIAKK